MALGMATRSAPPFTLTSTGAGNTIGPLSGDLVA